MSEVHICRGTNVQYFARVRYPGYQKYACGKRRSDMQLAMKDLFRMFDSRKHKRGDVLMTADWYDPIQLVEIVAK